MAQDNEAMIWLHKDVKKQIKVQAAKAGMTMKDYVKKLVQGE